MKQQLTNPRSAAAASLIAWEKNGRYANLEVASSLAASAMSDADRSLYTALVYGVIERVITLDYIIESLSSVIGLVRHLEECFPIGIPAIGNGQAQIGCPGYRYGRVIGNFGYCIGHILRSQNLPLFINVFGCKQRTLQSTSLGTETKKLILHLLFKSY